MNVLEVETKDGNILIGPFGHEDWARLYARDNLQGYPYRIVQLADPVQATNHLHLR